MHKVGAVTGCCASTSGFPSVFLQRSIFIHSGYVLRVSDQRARASVRVQAIGVFVSYKTATV